MQLTRSLLAATAQCRGLLCGSNTDTASSSNGTVVTRPGLFDTTPDINLKLLAPGPRVSVALTGPDKGVVGLPLLQKQQQTQAQQHPAAAGKFLRVNPSTKQRFETVNSSTKAAAAAAQARLWAPGPSVWHSVEVVGIWDSIPTYKQSLTQASPGSSLCSLAQMACPVELHSHTSRGLSTTVPCLLNRMLACSHRHILALHTDATD